ncbi:MAG: SGNH/GDSL hydrolase family protein, partial [Chloroflexi bacterium]|nr:SGNH/GDSL hydrolase family protein [Chloroflexota bacterium]
DQYRELLGERSKQEGWSYLDLWDLLPESEFTNSAIHLTPAGTTQLAQQIAPHILATLCQ